MLNWFARRLQEVQNKDKTGQGGFTLIELLVVVIILAAIAIPTFLAQRDKARGALVQADARTAGTAISTCLADKAVADCDTAAELDTYGYKPATKATQTFTQVGTPANGVQVVSKHNDSTGITATFNSTTGNLTTTP